MCVSVEIPNHQDILDKIHAHDVRLTRVETQQTSMAREITEQTTQLEKLREGLEKLGDKLERLLVAYSSVDGRLKLVLAVIGFGVPAIIGLEIWAGLRG
jgi:archaellum component FlaC